MEPNFDWIDGAQVRHECRRVARRRRFVREREQVDEGVRIPERDGPEAVQQGASGSRSDLRDPLGADLVGVVTLCLERGDDGHQQLVGGRRVDDDRRPLALSPPRHVRSLRQAACGETGARCRSAAST
jgi:hypothetical protein